MLKKTQKKLKIITQNVAKLFVAAWVIYALYLVAWAAPRYESQSQMIIKTSDGGNSFDPTSMLMSTVTDAPLSTDSILVESFILSRDMFDYLVEELNLVAQYNSEAADFFSRLALGSSKEDMFQYYLDHIDVSVDSESAVITLKTQAFNREFAQVLNAAIIEHAEAFINEINNNLAKSKLGFAKDEHKLVEEKLRGAKEELLAFQSKYNVLDPTAEGAASQQIAFSLEATLAQKQAELRTMSGMMSELAPEMKNLKRQISALQDAVSQQKSDLNNASVSENSDISMTELMAQYSNLQIQLQLAIQAYSSSLMTLESTRVKAYEKIQHLVTIENPTQPDDNKYPQVIYNLTLFGVILFLVYGIGRIVVATIKEL